MKRRQLVNSLNTCIVLKHGLQQLSSTPGPGKMNNRNRNLEYYTSPHLGIKLLLKDYFRIIMLKES